MSKAKGRPEGSRNKSYPEALVEPSRCPKCGSTNRSAYLSKHEQTFAGLDASGQPYTHIIRQRTSCDDCGQHRIDRTLENRPAARAA